jgi:hypothetical protein
MASPKRLPASAEAGYGEGGRPGEWALPTLKSGRMVLSTIIVTPFRQGLGGGQEFVETEI